METNLTTVMSHYRDDVDAVTEWCEDIYNDMFSHHFTAVRHLYCSLQCKSKPISDTELESILIDLPLELFTVAEKVNKLRIEHEVLKMKIKEKKFEIVENSSQPTAAKRTEEATIQTLEDELLLTSYANVMSRVDQEISFSRELIMSAKKVWDSRKNSTNVHPVSPISPGDELPNYNPSSTGGSTYIR